MNNIYNPCVVFCPKYTTIFELYAKVPATSISRTTSVDESVSDVSFVAPSTKTLVILRFVDILRSEKYLFKSLVL